MLELAHTGSRASCEFCEPIVKCWSPEIVYGEYIYITNIIKHCKSGPIYLFIFQRAGLP